MSKYRIAVILLACLSSFLCLRNASALNFDFSFSNTWGGVPGTVTGTVFGLTDNASSQTASSIILTSVPVVFDAPGDSGHGQFGDDPTTWPVQTSNSFTVVSDVITEATFYASTDGALSGRVLFNLGLNSGYYMKDVDLIGGITLDEILGSYKATNWEASGSKDTILTPEPSTISLIGLGTMYIVAVAYIRRKK